MGKWHDYFKDQKHCRWCGTPYRAHVPKGKDGFCSGTCKQAHYRAYKAYVTKKKLELRDRGSRYPKMSNNEKEKE